MYKIFTLALATLSSLQLSAQVARPHKSASRQAKVVAKAADLPGKATIISSQPEGTVYKNLSHYFEGTYVNSTDNGIYEYLGDGYVDDIVKAEDGSLYIKNPFGFFNVDDAEVWVKVDKGEGNTYEVKLPQAVYDNEGGEDPILYAWRYVKNGGDTYATVDAASQIVKFELRNDSLVKIGEKDAFIGLGAADGYFYGYGDTVSIYNKVKDVAPVPADLTKAVSYKLSYNDQNDESAAKTVRVVFEGDKVYIGDFDTSQPDLWFTGTIDGNRLRLTKWQYMGIDSSNTTYGNGRAGHMYLYPFGWGNFTDADGNQKYGLYEVETPSFEYDASTKSFSTDELTLAVNRGHNYYPYVYYSKPKFVPSSLAGVGSVEADNAVDVVYYSLDGCRVLTPAKGVYVKAMTFANGKKSIEKVVLK